MRRFFSTWGFDLGKTAITLTALTPDHLPALVTAPKRVTENVWAEENALWRPDLRIAIAAGTPANRARALRSGADVVVIGRDNLHDALAHTDRFTTFALDELSGFKSRASRRWKSARTFLRESKVPYVWGLTGTPSPNGLLDLWAQMFLLDGGERLGRTLGAYRSHYFTPGRQLSNGVITEWILREGADVRIHALLEDICLSMTSEGRVDLPPVTFNDVVVPLTPQTRALYRTMKDDLVVNLDILGGQVHTAANAAILTSKLSQISAGMLYTDEFESRAYTVIHHEKTRAVQEIVEGTGSPVLVFYHFRAEREMLTAAMPDLVHSIDEPDAVARWNRGEIPVLLAHPQSAGHGLNLQKGPGHTIVWTTLPWSLEEWEQGNKRLLRQGQAHPVVIHTLMSPHTIDPLIRDALAGKTSVQDALLAHLESPL